VGRGPYTDIPSQRLHLRSTREANSLSNLRNLSTSQFPQRNGIRLPRNITLSSPHFLQGSLVGTCASSDNGYHLYTYDVANRLAEADLYTNGSTFYRSIKIAYPGQTTQVTDPNGNTVTKVTDVAGKIRQVTDPSTNNTVAGTTNYTFDPFGNLIGSRRPRKSVIAAAMPSRWVSSAK
jgi:hypothetical protein